ncbi:winged helix DNA-binding domain-containing protein [Chitinophaga sp. NPDC101104]|uniref:winged helix DNA-binding domain-containing protein n=1 Tax=Chitinophaga sp. NPDC101104 TaxID=3390561 RepID=UPI003D01A947
MNPSAILATRLERQFLSSPSIETPASVVAHICAMQAQDFAGAKWSLGMRCKNLTDDGVEKLLEKREIIRISNLRGTLHFVHPQDVRWMATLVTPRVKIQGGSQWKKLGLDADSFSKVYKIFRQVLKNGEALSRNELKTILDKKRIDTSDHRMNQFLTMGGLEQVICCGPRRGKEFTYVLLDEWLPQIPYQLSHGPLTELAIRYLKSRGPATPEDFSWWCGFPVTACRRAFEEAGSAFESFSSGEKTYYLTPGETAVRPDTKVRLLSGFDEYHISYADRSMVADGVPAGVLSPPNGILPNLVISKGKIVGTWRREIRKNGVEMVYIPFEGISIGEERLVTAANRYGKFMGLPAAWVS